MLLLRALPRLLGAALLCTTPPAGHVPPQCGGTHTFMAASWAKTCECASAQMAPQSNGSFCLTEPACTRINKPCSKQCPPCNLSVATNVRCATFDNIFEMERIIPPNIPQNADGHWFGFGDFANETVPYFINATNSHPPGRHTLLLHDLDQNIGSDPDDRVLLPPAFAHCDVETAQGVWDPSTCIVPPCPQKAPTGPGFRSIFLDAAVAKRRAQSVQFFAQFKAAGGVLDELVMDVSQKLFPRGFAFSERS